MNNVNPTKAAIGMTTHVTVLPTQDPEELDPDLYELLDVLL